MRRSRNPRPRSGQPGAHGLPLRTRRRVHECRRRRRAGRRCCRRIGSDRGRASGALSYSNEVSSPAAASIDDIREYWNRHIHDLEITQHPVGTPGFFADLDEYHFEKLHHLLHLVNFDGYRGRQVLEVGCGAGTDLARFARGGAIAFGVDLSSSAIALAKQNFEQQGLKADLREANGERLPFANGSFDLVYAHGVVQYTAHPQQLVDECRRVLKPGGEAVFQAYNRISWLNALSKLMKVPLEHDDAPVLRKYSEGEFRG